VTLDDLERLKRHSCRKDAFYRTHQKNSNEEWPILLAATSRSMILASRNVRYMRVFAWIPREGGVKRRWGCRRRHFPAISVTTSSDTFEIRHYYMAISNPLPVCNLIAKWVTISWMAISCQSWFSYQHFSTPRVRHSKTIAWKVSNTYPYYQRQKYTSLTLSMATQSICCNFSHYSKAFFTRTTLFKPVWGGWNRRICSFPFAIPS